MLRGLMRCARIRDGMPLRRHAAGDTGILPLKRHLFRRGRFIYLPIIRAQYADVSAQEGWRRAPQDGRARR